MKEQLSKLFEVLGFLSVLGLFMSGMAGNITLMILCCGIEFLCFWISSKLENKPFIRKE